MCGNEALFYEFGSVSQQTVKLGNDTRMQVSNKGSIKMEVDDVNFTAGDVVCVPEIKNSLLSIGQLQERDLSNLTEAGMCKIFHPHKGLIIQTKMTVNRMFILVDKMLLLSLQSKQKVCFNATSDDLSHLWNCRLGHISNTNLEKCRVRRWCMVHLK